MKENMLMDKERENEQKEILVEQVEFLKDQVYQKDETIKYLLKLLYGDKHNKNSFFART